jgi:hypothetical protein
LRTPFRRPYPRRRTQRTITTIAKITTISQVNRGAIFALVVIVSTVVAVGARSPAIARVPES